MTKSLWQEIFVTRISFNNKDFEEISKKAKSLPYGNRSLWGWAIEILSLLGVVLKNCDKRCDTLFKRNSGKTMFTDIQIFDNNMFVN